MLLLIHNPYTHFQRISTGDLTQVFSIFLIYYILITITSSWKFDPNVCCTVPLDIPEESLSLGHIEPSRDPERFSPQHMVDQSDSEVCRALRTQSVGPHSASPPTPAVQFSSRLTELDAQLAALQNIADCLEKDFSNSRMVLKHVIIDPTLIIMTCNYLSINAEKYMYYIVLCVAGEHHWKSCSWCEDYHGS